MTEYALIISGSNLKNGLYEVTQWLGDIPTYGVVVGVALCLLLLHLFAKKIENGQRQGAMHVSLPIIGIHLLKTHDFREEKRLIIDRDI